MPLLVLSGQPAKAAIPMLDVQVITISDLLSKSHVTPSKVDLSVYLVSFLVLIIFIFYHCSQVHLELLPKLSHST